MSFGPDGDDMIHWYDDIHCLSLVEMMMTVWAMMTSLCGDGDDMYDMSNSCLL